MKQTKNENLKAKTSAKIKLTDDEIVVLNKIRLITSTKITVTVDELTERVKFLKKYYLINTIKSLQKRKLVAMWHNNLSGEYKINPLAHIGVGGKPIVVNCYNFERVTTDHWPENYKGQDNSKL